MKKVLPPHFRKRALSEEEKALWRAVAKSTTPLRRRRPAILDDDEDEEVHPPQPVARQSRPSSAPRPRTAVAKPSPPPLAPLGRREKSRLAKGRNAIDARIDLHGMTQARAHRALIAFLHRAHGDGATFVLIITGKGKASVLDGERGVLRRQVPLWLALPDLRSLVVGYEEAHIGHGGEGALYVRLRRAR
jgi:DNA-nicking Smr family endonuclease